MVILEIFKEIFKLPDDVNLQSQTLKKNSRKKKGGMKYYVGKLRKLKMNLEIYKMIKIWKWRIDIKLKK